MKIWCMSRESDASLSFEIGGEKAPRMLAIPETFNGHQRLREFELLKDQSDSAVYVETQESANRARIAA